MKAEARARVKKIGRGGCQPGARKGVQKLAGGFGDFQVALRIYHGTCSIARCQPGVPGFAREGEG